MKPKSFSNRLLCPEGLLNLGVLWGSGATYFIENSLLVWILTFEMY